MFDSLGATESVLFAERDGDGSPPETVPLSLAVRSFDGEAVWVGLPLLSERVAVRDLDPEVDGVRAERDVVADSDAARVGVGDAVEVAPETRIGPTRNRPASTSTNATRRNGVTFSGNMAKKNSNSTAWRGGFSVAIAYLPQITGRCNQWQWQAILFPTSASTLPSAPPF